VVWGLQYDAGTNSQYAKESRKFVRLKMRCVKARDFQAPEDLRIQLKPYIEDKGDFATLECTAESIEMDGRKGDLQKLTDVITADPTISLQKLTDSKVIDGSRKKITAMLEKDGWSKSGLTGTWERNEQPSF